MAVDHGTISYVTEDENGDNPLKLDVSDEDDPDVCLICLISIDYFNFFYDQFFMIE